MENSFQTSFIPKKPIVANNTVSAAGNTTSISMVVSVSILIVMLLASGGLYFYKDYLTKNRIALSESLKKVKESFNNDTIAELEAYDKTSTVAKQVLDEHIVLSPLFNLLNELTLTSIQYTKFDHSMTNNIFTVRMSGITRDYNSISVQADVFNTSKGRMFKNVVFSNLTKDKNNFVTFNVEFDVDPDLLSYSKNLANIPVNTTKDISSDASLDTPAVVLPTSEIVNTPTSAPTPNNTPNNNNKNKPLEAVTNTQ